MDRYSVVARMVEEAATIVAELEADVMFQMEDGQKARAVEGMLKECREQMMSSLDHLDKARRDAVQ